MRAHIPGHRLSFLAVATVAALSWLSPAVLAQGRPDWDWDGNYRRLPHLNAGTFVTVRTTHAIDSRRADGRVYSAVVAEDVWDDYRRLSVPAIPRGSRVDLVVRTARDGDLMLDLLTIYAHGERYAVSAMPERIESGEGRRRGRIDNEDAAEWIAGGAILGTIIGAIAGDEKGAALGAAAGAAAGLGMAYRGRAITVPAGARLTFRLDEPLEIAPAERQYRRPRR